jgi:hypothetical protein
MTTEVFTPAEQNEELFEADREDILRQQARAAVAEQVAGLAMSRTVIISAPETFED